MEDQHSESIINKTRRENRNEPATLRQSIDIAAVLALIVIVGVSIFNHFSKTNSPTYPVNASVQGSDLDTSSNAYRTMFTVGQNFAKVSMSSDTAIAQCDSALKSGFISAQGHPQYLGQQTQMIQSYLQTPDGFQGCLDGFGS
jgi:hypothetical protein